MVEISIPASCIEQLSEYFIQDTEFTYEEDGFIQYILKPNIKAYVKRNDVKLEVNLITKNDASDYIIIEYADAFEWEAVDDGEIIDFAIIKC